MMQALSDFGQNPISLTMASSFWVVPTMQSIHILAIAVIFLSVLVVVLRLLGLAWVGQSVRQTTDRFTPWVIGALVVLGCTGLVLILAEPVRELMAVSLWLKMALLLIAVLISLRFLRALKRDPVYWDQKSGTDSRIRGFAVLTIGIWVGLIFLGRFIAYDPLVWGHLSPLAVG